MKKGTRIRSSLDAKAKLNIGEFSRNGKSRDREAKKAEDHDMNPKIKLLPYGILNVLSEDRIEKRLGATQPSIHNHLLKMATLPNSINRDLSRGFTVSQVAENHNWTEPMVCSLAIKDKEDLEFLEAFFAVLKQNAKKRQDLPSSMRTGMIFRTNQRRRII